MEKKSTFTSDTSLYQKEVFVDKRADDIDKQYDEYRFSVAQKLDLATRHLTFKKVRYIKDEVLHDLKLKKWKTLAFQMNVFLLFCLYFLRLFTHYIGQFLILRIIGIPVSRFEPHWYKFYIEYTSWNFVQELLIVAGGVLLNTLLFSFLVGLAFVSRRFCKCFPRSFYKAICWIGVLTFFDFLIIGFTDTLSLVSLWPSDTL